MARLRAQFGQGQFVAATVKEGEVAANIVCKAVLPDNPAALYRVAVRCGFAGDELKGEFVVLIDKVISSSTGRN